MSVPATPSGSRATHEASISVESSPEASIPNADEIAAALELMALMDGIDAAGGKITVTFPRGGGMQ